MTFRKIKNPEQRITALLWQVTVNSNVVTKTGRELQK
jgi:hypothetical protein